MGNFPLVISERHCNVEKKTLIWAYIPDLLLYKISYSWSCINSSVQTEKLILYLGDNKFL